MSRSIQVTLNFSEEDLDRILKSVSIYGDVPPVSKLTDEQFALFKEVMEESAGAFVEEIIDGSGGDDCWLSELTSQFDE